MTTTTAPDFMQIVARQKLGPKAADWHVYRWELIGDAKTARDFVVGIGQTRTKTRGAGKGNRTWRDTKGKMLPNDQVIVTGAEMDAARAKYEHDTGLCSACGGSGQRPYKWSASAGTEYRDCDRCHGTGKAQ